MARITNLTRGIAAMIAGAVAAFVVLADDGGESRECRRTRQHSLAIIGMQAHLLPFLPQ